MRMPGSPTCSLLAALILLLSSSAEADEISPGARIWQRCAVCHGADGEGRSDGTFPKIAGQHASVVVAQLEAIRSGERPNPVMKPHVQELSDARDVPDVAAYIAAMPRADTCDAGPGDDLERGAGIYAKSCASCHGEAGQGDAAEGAPWLACQHYAYLVRRARQLASWGRSAHPEVDPPLSSLSDAELRAVMDHALRLGAAPPRDPAGAE